MMKQLATSFSSLSLSQKAVRLAREDHVPRSLRFRITHQHRRRREQTVGACRSAETWRWLEPWKEEMWRA